MRQGIAAGLRALGRPRRAVFVPFVRRVGLRPILLATSAACLVIALLMWFTDAAAEGRARSLPRPVIAFFQHVTDFGLSGWILVPVAAALVVIALRAAVEPSRMSRDMLSALAMRLSFLFLAVAVPGLLVAIVKRMIGRARPYIHQTTDPFSYDFFAWKSSWASFPSGHATTAIAFAMALSMLWPRVWWLGWSYALLIVVSRVVVGVHFTSDVLGGAFFAIACVLLIRDYFAARGLVFAHDTANGRISAMPGPSWRRLRAYLARAIRRGP
ncbi:MAG: phosphatase PAP2 family protein [Pseudorhodoplanes sp.]